MVYTLRKPTRPGWYWCRNTGDTFGPYAAPEAEFVCRVDYFEGERGKLACSWMTAPGKAAVLHEDKWDPGAKWAGPIPHPTD
jgi:hypothetical protein